MEGEALPCSRKEMLVAVEVVGIEHSFRGKWTRLSDRADVREMEGLKEAVCCRGSVSCSGGGCRFRNVGRRLAHLLQSVGGI